MIPINALWSYICRSDGILNGVAYINTLLCMHGFKMFCGWLSSMWLWCVNKGQNGMYTADSDCGIIHDIEHYSCKWPLLFVSITPKLALLQPRQCGCTSAKTAALMLHNVLMHVGSRDYSNSERNSGRKILSNIITLSAGHAYSKRKRITCELWQHCDACGCHYTKHASTTFFFAFS